MRVKLPAEPHRLVMTLESCRQDSVFQKVREGRCTAENPANFLSCGTPPAQKNSDSRFFKKNKKNLYSFALSE
jgi:hypothetical protein